MSTRAGDGYEFAETRCKYDTGHRRAIDDRPYLQTQTNTKLKHGPVDETLREGQCELPQFVRTAQKRDSFAG